MGSRHLDGSGRSLDSLIRAIPRGPRKARARLAHYGVPVCPGEVPMQVNLFELAAKQSQWLSVRQSAIAANIANANTFGFRALEVEPFEKVLDGTQVGMRATQAAHLSAGADAVAVRQRDDGGSMLLSQNSVVIENELMNAGEVRRAFELNTAIVRAFNRMTLLVTKG
jgi:flagellar basal-body rod protein FlgB